MKRCSCSSVHRPRRIVLTGGPGAGKTAVLEVLRRAMCRHVMVLPEAAGLVFTGGFPRGVSPAKRRATQRAIYFVQRELEASALDDEPAILMCDRGTVDGLAYWPGPEDMWQSVGSTLADELAHYDAVIHLRTPALGAGYNHDNPLRVETAAEAAAIDARIAEAWARHPRRFEVTATPEFFDKVTQAVAIVRDELPACCRGRHVEARIDRAVRASMG
jgi:predicted ATPase